MEEFPGEVIIVGQLVMWALCKKKLCNNFSNNFNRHESLRREGTGARASTAGNKRHYTFSFVYGFGQFRQY
jgi:hypothetical protein